MTKDLDAGRSQIGVQLKTWREAAGLTQAAAAERMGVTAITVSRWERGVVGSIEPGNIAAIGRAYRVPLSNVLTLLGVNDYQLDTDVPRGTTVGTFAPPLPAERAKRIKDFLRESARRGATDQELDHMEESLTSGSSRSFYLGGDGQEEDLEDLIAGLRVWLERRVAKREAAERHERGAKPGAIIPAPRPNRKRHEG